jgi:hypothetical protein
MLSGPIIGGSSRPGGRGAAALRLDAQAAHIVLGSAKFSNN